MYDLTLCSSMLKSSSKIQFQLVIFCNSGGRFHFTNDQCASISEGCRRPLGRFEPIFPAPAGGMRLDKIAQMRKRYGDDTMLLIGGNLLEQGPDLEMDAKIFLRYAGRDEKIDSLSGKKRMHESLALHDSKTDPMDCETSHTDVEQIARAVVCRVLEYTIKNNGGYLSQACSGSIILSTLYIRALRLGPSIVRITSSEIMRTLHNFPHKTISQNHYRLLPFQVLIIRSCILEKAIMEIQLI